MLGIGKITGGAFPGVYELLGWLPALGLSALVGIGSLTEDMMDWPVWISFLIGTYQTIVYPLVHLFAEDLSNWMIDAGAIALGAVTLISRMILEFVGSAIVFAALAAAFFFIA